MNIKFHNNFCYGILISMDLKDTKRKGISLWIKKLKRKIILKL